MAHQENLFPLKMLVISLGALLVGGVIVIALALTGRMEPKCQDATMNLPDKTELNVMYNDGKILRFLVKTGGNAADIITVDACNPEKRHILKIAPSAPEKAM